MELMLEIKRRNFFKDGGRAKLNCVVLGLRRFFFGFGFGVDRLHYGGEIIFHYTMYFFRTNTLL
jgi:hypothetical protein